MCATRAGRAWLFSNHSPQTIPSGYSSIHAKDCLIAVDGGLELIKALGRKPDLVIGDLDSLEEDIDLSGLEVLRYAREKNETDTELALLWALDRGYREIIIANDLGGRFDHALGLLQNLELCSTEENNIRIESREQIVFFLKSQNSLHYPQGSLLSLVARSPEARFGHSSGLQYPLDGLTLYPQLSRGISNSFSSDMAEIELLEGKVLGIVTLFN